MLQVIHRYYRSVLGLVVIIIMALAMLLFGVDFGSRNTQSYAIKVDEQEISFTDFYDRKSQVQRRLAEQLGPNYGQFAEQLLRDLSQRLSDELIEEALLRNAATELGLAPGRRYVQQMVQQIFPEGFTQEKYRTFLRQQGASAPQFESQLAADTIIQQLRGLFQHTSAYPPEDFVKASFVESERTYSVDVVTFDPATMTDSVEAPADDVLKEFFEGRMLDYEEPAKAKVRYIEFLPANFEGEAEVLEEDVELFYTDNQRNFRTPAEVKVQRLVLNLPKEEENPGAAIGVQSLANDLRIRLESGEDIEALAKEYSDDKSKGKLSDWISKGKNAGEFDDQVFSEESAAGDIFLFEKPKTLELVKLVEKKEAELKPLEEVREDIANQLRKREAPIYAAETARELFDEWRTSEMDIAEVATKAKLTVQEIAQPTSIDAASPVQRPIVKSAVEAMGDQKLLIDVGKALALVSVDEFKESEIPGFDAIKDKVLADYKTEEASQVAATRAEEYLAKIAEAGEFNPKLHEEFSGTHEAISEKKISEMRTAPLSSSTIRDAVRGGTAGAPISNEPFIVDGKRYVVWLSAVNEPDDKQFDEKKGELVQGAQQQLARLMEQSLLNHMKAKADIDVHPAVFE